MNGPRPYSVRVKRSAEKEMDRLPKAIFDRAARAILLLERNPRPVNSKKLRGVEDYRLRLGDYRVLYIIDDAHRLVEIIAVGLRRDVYRGI